MACHSAPATRKVKRGRMQAHGRALRSSAFEDDLCDRVLRGVRQSEVRALCAQLFEDFEGAAVKDEPGRARFYGRDLHVVPGDAARPARAQSFERRFFGRKTRRIMLSRGHPAARRAVKPFAFGEDAFDKARRALQNGAHALDFDNIDTDGNDHGR